MLNPQVEQSKASVDSFTLPCGYLDPEGNLHTDIEVVEMTGDDEEVLAARNMPVMKKLNKILSNCTKAVGPYRDASQIEQIVQDLTQGDRVFLLFAIRRVSLGDDFPMTTECPKCEKKSHPTIDLSELEIRKMADPKVRTYDIKLRKSKLDVSMKVLTGRGEEAISKASSSGKAVVSHAMLARINAIGGKPANIDALLDLSLADRNQIRDEWQDREGGVETGVDLQCPQCDHEYEADVDMASVGFFNPLAALKASKTKSSR